MLLCLVGSLLFKGQKRRRSSLSAALTGAAIEQPCFLVDEVPGRGLGVVATRELQAGELILCEKPLLTFDANGPFWPAKAKRQLARLPQNWKRSILALTDTFRGSGRKSLKGIIKTNAFSCYLGSTDMVVCNVTSRFNHCCNSNCEQSWQDDLRRMEVYASSNIAAGTELCIRYIDTRSPLLERQQLILERYGFECCCSVCRDACNSKSDKRRWRMADLAELVENESYRQPQELLSQAQELLALYDDEGLQAQSFRMWACEAACTAAAELGHRAKAREWCTKALRSAELCHGSEHEEVRELRERLSSI